MPSEPLQHITELLWATQSGDAFRKLHSARSVSM
jgi:hypothetical protein